ncbi:MAG TPA: Hsp33 family molecular chaperone HslO [Methylococcaceae bacterium]|nr:Hsp33 family molecular chaperone HslO [Methylococcaceae bacterium]
MQEHDCLRRFLFEKHGIRGVWVQLTGTWQEAKRHQKQPDIALNTLGQALAATTMLSTTVKFDGALVLQAQSDGAISTLVAQASNQGKIRGVVRTRAEINTGTLQELFGQGQLVISIDTGTGQPYQGVVALQGDTIAQALQTYFEHSEQLKTRLWLFANATHAAGLLLQALPSQEETTDSWDTLEILANTLTQDEIFGLDCHDLLHRLFHEEEVRLFPSEPVAFECSCSRERIENTLRAMEASELYAILDAQQIIEVTCEFCNKTQTFHHSDIDTLLQNS